MEAVKTDWRTAVGLSPAEKAVLAYAEKLTASPASMQEADVQALRNAGCSDTDILDAALVAAYYNFVNRLAEGLGVELER